MSVSSLSLMKIGMMQSGGVAPFDPEAGLTLSRTLAISSTHPGSDFGKDSNSTVLAMDFTGLDGSSGGMIYEFGGSGTGVYAGFRANGDVMVRAGRGTDPVDVNTAYVLLNGGHTTVSGTGTLVVEFNRLPVLQTRVWWNGNELGSPVDAATNYAIAGNNDGGIFVIGGANAVLGEVTAPVIYSTCSGLRVYENQLVS